jgi:uncharacterized membrane protein SpoIIM required for sporulation
MNRERFIKQRRTDWQQFEKLVGRMQSTRIAKWRSGDVAALSRLYRSICYDLSLVQSREWGARLEQYLNDLVAQGHNCLYRSPPQSLTAVTEFLMGGFPALLRRRKGSFQIALALFLLPFTGSMIVGWVRPDLAEFVVTQQSLEATEENFGSSLYSSLDDRYATERSLMSGFYVFNNAGIALQAFALGSFCGIGTAIILLFNGIELGFVTGFVASRNGVLAENFFSFVVTHGAFELTAIVIAGAAGLVLGQGILFPEDMTRTESLRKHGIQSLQLALGAAAMLVIAALIEAFFSPLPMPALIKYIVGGFAWFTVVLYLWKAGAGMEEPE